ncbi:MAG: DUF1778 domain-containing protein [Gammaproteobacteria bacterium]|nr:MAG: DUF1778 domain-containing protein [Gammaproteobacteria bacterium]RLA33060.1 MAG: DUF1778 domain-containing protein [Gammaproteobacteria bacterium]
MATKLTKNERLELRCTKGQRRLINQAVELHGGSLTDFILGAAQEKAMQTIREYQVLQLGQRDSLQLVDALLNAPAPNAQLKKAARRYASAS